MAIVANLLNTIGLVLLAHAIYSSYEHSLLISTTPSSSPTDSLPAHDQRLPALPIDVIIETLTSVLILCLGIVLASAELKPIRWHVWAGGLERDKDARKVKAFGEGGGNPYARLEDRAGFLDVKGLKAAGP